jgi:SAM-dependent methyltransferase
MSKWTDPRSALRHAFLYKGLQTIIGGRRARRLFVEHYVRSVPGQRVLDVGCGPGDILDYLPGVDYYGFDVNPVYIEAAQRTYGDRGTFICSGIDEFVVPEPGTFDLVLALGVLHHLSDQKAQRLFHQAAQAIRPTGRLMTLDGCFVPHQNAVARLLLKADRGEYVREQAAYEKLAHAQFKHINSTIEEHFFHVPYTLLLMECHNKQA